MSSPSTTNDILAALSPYFPIPLRALPHIAPDNGKIERTLRIWDNSRRQRTLLDSIALLCAYKPQCDAVSLAQERSSKIGLYIAKSHPPTDELRGHVETCNSHVRAIAHAAAGTQVGNSKAHLQDAKRRFVLYGYRTWLPMLKHKLEKPRTKSAHGGLQSANGARKSLVSCQPRPSLS
ncbi:hypothetical protein FA95DRAFT_1072925 [Auriscalpium vulgare]|uniref:Uncharacterized protein n=1 Tax=Auriscalpium vulgare TaxID=40419 RepID=A0ACB8RXT0_9AGAM|nr:hypothetical protein FA95DRAFT_1072925 [Auriscalpium vulgare]